VNSARPTLPFGSAVQALLHLFKSLSAQVRGFLGSSKLDARASIQIVSVYCMCSLSW
jgi:hypothetical protein